MTINLGPYQDEIDKVQPGETHRYDHRDCPAGEDHRRRLYLTRPAGSPEVCLAYCHNCSDSGIRRSDGVTYRGFDSTVPINNKAIDFSMPIGLSILPSTWPTVAKFWRMEKDLTEEQCIDAGICYDPNTNRMFLPMYDEVNLSGVPSVGSQLVGYQLRRLEGRNAKYLTAVKDSSTKPYTRFNRNPKTSVCYLVEDLASGIHLAQVNVGVVVNYGVKVNPETLHANSDTEYSAVWLDNDSDIVIEQARTIQRTWSLISGRTTFLVSKFKDPKYYSTGELIDIHNQEVGV